MLRVSVVAGRERGIGLSVNAAMSTVGRHPSNDLVIDDPEVSGVHLTLRRIHGRLFIRDEHSTNGTWIDNQRIIEAELLADAELTIGSTRLRVESEDHAQPSPVLDAFGNLVGESAIMRELFAVFQRVAKRDLGLLIQGPTGTGKEATARAIHDASARRSGPFVVLDAAALPDAHAEALLFGFEDGGGEGGRQPRPGFFERSDGGTIFIDQVGDLPASLQAKLLRVIERHEITRIGGQKPHRIDVRFIAASQRDLRMELEAGRFREDLYYRIAPIRIQLPALRERTDDIPVLARALLQRVSAVRGTELHLTADALAFLTEQPWPGNVRELENALMRAVALAESDIIRREDVAGEGFGFRGTVAERSPMALSGTFHEAKERFIEVFEATYLEALMKRCRGNITHAAREANLERHHLRDALRRRDLYGVPWDER